MAEKASVSVSLDTLTAEQKLDAILRSLNVKGEAAYQTLETRNAKLEAALTGVVAILETISDSANEVAHTRGPLAREALALIKEATQ